MSLTKAKRHQPEMRRHDRAAIARLATATAKLLEAHNDPDRSDTSWREAVNEYVGYVTNLLRQEIERGAKLGNEHAADLAGRSVRVDPELPDPAAYMDDVRFKMLQSGEPNAAAYVGVYLRDVPARVYRSTLRWAGMVASIEEEMGS